MRALQICLLLLLFIIIEDIEQEQTDPLVVDEGEVQSEPLVTEDIEQEQTDPLVVDEGEVQSEQTDEQSH